MPGNNILLRRLPIPKRVQQLNGHVFFAKHQKVGRYTLAPTRVWITRTYISKIRPRQQRVRRIGPKNQRRKRQQTEAELDPSTAIDSGRRAAGSRIGKMMINDAIDYIPMAYKKINNKIINKKVQSVMDTGVDDYLVNRGAALIGERFN